MKKYIQTSSGFIAAIMAMSLALSGLFTVISTEREIEKDLVRLHILASSDSEYDQQMKIMVRDELLSHSDEIFEPYSTAEQAKASLENQLDRIKEIADKALAENGSTDTVSCQLETVTFDKRIYDNFTVPAGEYTALRIKIGSGSGKNWWCVMYPPLCVPCAGVDMTDEEIIEKYGTDLSDEEIALMMNTEEYEARLYIVELIEKLLDK